MKFWQENQGQLKGQYWQLPLESPRKPPEEIASKKRSMYRKRYEMLDDLSEKIYSIFLNKNSLKPGLLKIKLGLGKRLLPPILLHSFKNHALLFCSFCVEYALGLLINPNTRSSP